MFISDTLLSTSCAKHQCGLQLVCLVACQLVYSCNRLYATQDLCQAGVLCELCNPFQNCSQSVQRGTQGSYSTATLQATSQLHCMEVCTCMCVYTCTFTCDMVVFLPVPVPVRYMYMYRTLYIATHSLMILGQLEVSRDRLEVRPGHRGALPLPAFLLQHRLIVA